MTTKNMAYDHPAYLVRLAHAFGQNAAGASTAFGKFVAFTTLQVMAVQATNITAGTSTQTAWNGSATTVSINADQFYAVHVNVGTAVTTATHGPFSISAGITTSTATSGVTARIELSGTGTGSVQGGADVGDGGFAMQPGDTLHILRGADATAVSAFVLEYGLQPLANVTQ